MKWADCQTNQCMILISSLFRHAIDWAAHYWRHRWYESAADNCAYVYDQVCLIFFCVFVR